MIGTIIFFGYVIWNVFCFYLMFIDKMKAKNGKWRITEKKLLTAAIFFGAFGIAFGMIAFHHKTSKNTFSYVVGTGIFINIISIFLLLRMFL